MGNMWQKPRMENYHEKAWRLLQRRDGAEQVMGWNPGIWIPLYTPKYLTVKIL